MPYRYRVNISASHQKDAPVIMTSSERLMRALSAGEPVYAQQQQGELWYDFPESIEFAEAHTKVGAASEDAAPSEPDFLPILSVAGECINLAKLTSILSQCFSQNKQIAVKINPYSQYFSSSAIDIYCDSETELDKSKLMSLAQALHLDILIKLQVNLDEAGLLVMDMDSTVIAMECIDEIAAIAGVKEKVSAVTERAMLGEIAFAQSLHERVACLAGIHQTDLYAIRDRLPFMPGFVKTTQILQELQWTLAIASGGFTFFADYIKQALKLDYALSNRLEVIGDTLSGKVLGSIIDAKAKADALLKFQKECGLKQSQTVAIGDGANDLLMMEAAGNSVAFRAKPAVSKAADTSIMYCGFEALLYAMPHKF